MSTPLGHAAFHLFRDSPKHTGTKAGTKSQRRALLKESMRHLDPKDVARHAKKNASIVAADAHLNAGFVNDGKGGFRATHSVADVLAYGDAREVRVRRKIAEGQTTVNLFVVHLPKTLCVEIQDFYPRVSPDGTPRLDPITGEPMSRSRSVARDHDEAMRYFADAVAFLGDNVIPGGQEAVHGWATNFDETTPHIQLMADPFARDTKAPSSKPDALRTEQNQAYGSHREVLDRDGNQIGGKAKLRSYQAAMRAHMIAHGWPVESAPGPRREAQPKSEYEATQDEKAEAAVLRAAAAEARSQAEAIRAEALELQESAVDVIADVMAEQEVRDLEWRQEAEAEREDLYGELGVAYAALRRKEQQVADVLRIERQSLASERTKAIADHQRAVDALAVQMIAAEHREQAADSRERDAKERDAEFRRRLADAHEVHAAAQELGRQTVELAKANGVGVRAPNAAELKRARVAHDALLARFLPGHEADRARPQALDLER